MEAQSERTPSILETRTNRYVWNLKRRYSVPRSIRI